MRAQRLTAVVFSLGLASCFPYSELPNNRADPKVRKIADAAILDMKVHLNKQPGLCPGMQGKLYVAANVQWPGAKPVVRSLGSDVDSLDPSKFKVTGPLIKGDKNAALIPNADVLKSVETGFKTKIVYKLDPQFTFDVTFPPEYSCYSGWWIDGNLGGNGGEGAYGGDANGAGGRGGDGGTGDPGNQGGNGGTINASVTIVSTRYFPRLLAVIVGDNFFLAPADRELTFGAVGGQGGTGGTGGYGGNGGDQPVNDVVRIENGSEVTYTVGSGQGGDGGNGGDGGQGGQGGNGGTVNVTYDSRFSELRGLIATDVRGGAGGYGGGPGGGGTGGGSTAQEEAASGNGGGLGQNGGDGNGGGPGRANVRAGSVSNMFARFQGIAVFGTPEAQRLQGAPREPAEKTISSKRRPK